MITVFVADDHPIVRDGVRFLLNAQADITVIGEAANGREAVQQVARLRPDVVILDISMPELNGIEAAHLINAETPDTKILILSMHSTSEHIFRALQAGARGYLLKDSVGTKVVEAVREVYAGRRYLSQEISEVLIDGYVQQRESVSPENPLEALSSREREVFQLVVEGNSSVEIAGILFLSSKTVDTYRSRIMQKLAVNDLPSLVKLAIRHGVISLE
jgi:DNA-binding NarL/FixJ family response regulator